MGNSQNSANVDVSIDSTDVEENNRSSLNSKQLASMLVDQKVGYRILGVQSQSPASYTGLVAYFDFIVAANRVPLKTLDTTFIGLIKASEEKPLTLTIYNYKNHSAREVVLVPSRRWPGEGMLGATIRFDSFLDAEDHVIHVLEVEPNSPAEIAGLQPESDFLLGTAEKSFRDTDILFAELRAHLERPVEFFVYSSITDEVRVVVLMPSEDWGGEGILGANVAQGYLHRMPLLCCKTIGRSSEHLVPPAVLHPTTDSLSSVSVTVARSQQHHGRIAAINSPFGRNPDDSIQEPVSTTDRQQVTSAVAATD
jgi:hypothetical protein